MKNETLIFFSTSENFRPAQLLSDMPQGFQFRVISLPACTHINEYTIYNIMYICMYILYTACTPRARVLSLVNCFSLCIQIYTSTFRSRIQHPLFVSSIQPYMRSYTYALSNGVCEVHIIYCMRITISSCTYTSRGNAAVSLKIKSIWYVHRVYCTSAHEFDFTRK